MKEADEAMKWCVIAMLFGLIFNTIWSVAMMMSNEGMFFLVDMTLK